MTRSDFHQQIDDLRQELLRMGALVESQIEQAVAALAARDNELAQRVIDKDDTLDQMMLDIEQRCLQLLALQQPMAGDLRIIGTALKIVTDLERMGDHAVDIAKVNLRLGTDPLIKPLVDIPRMAEIARLMTREALRSYVDRDEALARSMIERDNEVDHLYSQIFRELLTYMLEDPSTVKQATYLMFVGLYLERIADHATNLGEWVIYMVTGKREELNN